MSDNTGKRFQDAQQTDVLRPAGLQGLEDLLQPGHGPMAEDQRARYTRVLEHAAAIVRKALAEKTPADEAAAIQLGYIRATTVVIGVGENIVGDAWHARIARAAIYLKPGQIDSDSVSGDSRGRVFRRRALVSDKLADQNGLNAAVKLIATACMHADFDHVWVAVRNGDAVVALAQRLLSSELDQAGLDRLRGALETPGMLLVIENGELSDRPVVKPAST